jgi:hypothetical protein
MATITLEEQDLKNADAFLTAFLSENIPDADFSQGSAIRDFVITAVAFMFAYLEKERKTTRDQQSLLALSTLPPDQSVDDAVNALLSNWFITRKDGQTARMTATLHFSAAVDIPLSPATRFYRTTDLIYVPDAPASFVIPASSLVPTFNADNVVVDYTTTVNLVAQNVGTAYNLPPGRFIQTDQFSPFFTYAEQRSAVNDGKDVESTADLLARAPTAITIRNLVNARSIDTTLREEFAGLERVLSIGFGDPEMMRDYSQEGVTKLQMHMGGYVDIYVQLPVSPVTETHTLGGPAARPDNVITILKDTSQDFVALGVEQGNVLRIGTGLPDAPREYIIIDVQTTQLTISPRAAFSEATEENVPATYVTYTIGALAPNYDDKLGATSTGVTSRTIQTPGRVLLQARPHYRISKVEVYDASPSPTIYELSSRVNNAPAAGEYRVMGLEPAQAQSALTVDQVEVNQTQFSGGPWNVRVTYDTLVGYSDIQSYVTDRFQRILASNPLVKGYTPVYLTVGIAYKLKIGSTTTLDTTAAANDLAAYINSFDLTTTLDVTAIIQYLRDNYPEIGVIVAPTVVTYNLYAPDGQVYGYATQDIVTTYPSYPNNNAQLTNGLALRTPISNADLDPTVPGNDTLVAAANKTLKDQLTKLGISDRTLIYLTTAEDISLTLVT